MFERVLMDSSVIHRVLTCTGWIGLVAVTGAIATLGAMLVGIGIVFVLLLPFSLLILMPPLLWQVLWTALLLASPTTLVILPVSAVFMRRRAVASLFLLPILGLVGGAATTWTIATLWTIDRWLWHSPAGSFAFETFLIAGTVAGSGAGALFGRALLEVGR
jgi:hypothetical protein